MDEPLGGYARVTLHVFVPSAGLSDAEILAETAALRWVAEWLTTNLRFDRSSESKLCDLAVGRIGMSTYSAELTLSRPEYRQPVHFLLNGVPEFLSLVRGEVWLQVTSWYIKLIIKQTWKGG